MKRPPSNNFPMTFSGVRLAGLCLFVALCAAPELCAQDVNALIRDLRGKDAMKQRRACEALEALGAKGAPAVNDLLRLLKDDYEPSREAAIKTLGAIGAPAVKGLIGTVKQAHPKAQPAAARALGLTGASAVKSLHALLKDKNKPARMGAAMAIREVGAPAHSCVPLLIDMLGDSDKQLRPLAAKALGGIGPGAKAAVPAFKKILQSGKSHDDVHAAIWALGHMGEQAVPLVADIARRAASGDTISIRAMGQLGMHAQSGVKELAKGLSYVGRYNSSKVHNLVLDSLRMIGPGALAVAPNLIKRLHSSNEEYSSGLIDALAAMGPQVIPSLTKGLGRDNQVVRFKIVRVLGRLGAEAIPALDQALRDEHLPIRLLAAEQLGRIGPQAVPVLGRALKAKEVEIRQAAAEGLGRLGVPAVATLLLAADDQNAVVVNEAAKWLNQLDEQAVPDLMKGATGGSAAQRRLAFDALASLGPKARAATAVCEQGLAHADAAVRFHAAVALCHVDDQKARGAVDILRPALKDASAVARERACRALALIEEAAAPAVDDLVALLKDDAWEVRCAAAEALGRIGPSASSAAESVVDALLQDRIWYSAVLALEGFGQGAHRVLPQLLKAQADGKTPIHIRARITQFFGRMKPTVPEVIAPLVTTFKSDADPVLQEMCVDALGQIGAPALPELLKAIEKPGGWPFRDICGRACRAIALIGPPASAAVPALIKLIDSKSGSWKNWNSEAMLALARIGPAAQDALPHLMAIVKKTNQYNNNATSTARNSALKAIRGIGKPAVGLMGELQKLQGREKDGGVNRTMQATIRALDNLKSK